MAAEERSDLSDSAGPAPIPGPNRQLRKTADQVNRGATDRNASSHAKVFTDPTELRAARFPYLSFLPKHLAVVAVTSAVNWLLHVFISFAETDSGFRGWLGSIRLRDDPVWWSAGLAGSLVFLALVLLLFEAWLMLEIFSFDALHRGRSLHHDGSPTSWRDLVMTGSVLFTPMLPFMPIGVAVAVAGVGVLWYLAIQHADELRSVPVDPPAPFRGFRWKSPLKSFLPQWGLVAVSVIAMNLLIIGVIAPSESTSIADFAGPMAFMLVVHFCVLIVSLWAYNGNLLNPLSALSTVAAISILAIWSPLTVLSTAIGVLALWAMAKRHYESKIGENWAGNSG